MASIPIEDINYLAQQSSGKINMILSGMTALMNDTDNKVETMESQGWFKRMINTVSGKNKITKDEIRKNHDKLNAYMSQAIAELYNRNCIDEKVMMSLGIQLNELYADHVQLKQMLGAFVSKLNEKIDSVDNFHMLATEIDQGIYSFDTPIFAICKIISQFDKRILDDSRKLDIIRRSMVSQNIINDEQIILTDYLNHILQIPVEEIGQIYLELGTIKDNFISKVILSMIEEYHFLPDMARKIKNKESLIKEVIENEKLDGTITLSISDIYDDIISSKLDINNELISINNIESNLNLCKSDNKQESMDLSDTDDSQEDIRALEISNKEYDVRLERAEQLYADGELDSALELFKVLEEEGNGRAIYFIGKYYECGYSDIEIDLNKAKEYYIKAANTNSVGGANELGKNELNNGNYRKAIQWFEKDAQNGYADAQNRLGVRYFKGEGVEKDFKEAFKWFIKAAEQGHVKAQTNVGICYYFGRGVSIDYEKSKEWLREASRQGYYPAISILSKWYNEGYSNYADTFIRDIYEDDYDLIKYLCNLYGNRYGSKFYTESTDLFNICKIFDINDYCSEVYLVSNINPLTLYGKGIFITNNGIFTTKRTNKFLEINSHISFYDLAKSSEISVKKDTDMYINKENIGGILDYINTLFDEIFNYCYVQYYDVKDNAIIEFIDLLNIIKKLVSFDY